MAAMFEVLRHIVNPTLTIEEYLLEKNIRAKFRPDMIRNDGA